MRGVRGLARGGRGRPGRVHGRARRARADRPRRWRRVSDLLRHVERQYWERNQLHALILELTHRCPCRCRHCYVVPSGQTDELSTDEVTDLLDQARDEGVFHLVLTGGEVFLRDDLEPILAHARSHRFLVSVLTSGLTVDASGAAMLARHRVAAVELSLLGATEPVNDDLMRRPGALARIRTATAHLVRAGLRVTLKATVMAPNRHELAAMADLARGLGAAFHASPLLAPRREEGDPLDELALPEREIAALDPALLGGGLIPGEDAGGGAVLVCKAGRTVAGVSAAGDVYPCIMWPRTVGNVRERSLKDIWHDAPDPFLTGLRAVGEHDLTACAGCEHRLECRRCPGMAWQETGSHTAPGERFCAAAGARAEVDIRPL
ncbi:radical SAM protein, partial [bacterium]|nr:radical SAM protein [bacterium]